MVVNTHLSLGAHVDIQHPRTKLWSAHGSIVAIGQHRDYLVKLPSGRIYWRNRRFLRPRVSPTPPPAAAVPTVYAPDAAQGQTPVASIAPGVHAPAQPAPRRSHRHRQQNVPFNVISTRGQSYDWWLCPHSVSALLPDLWLLLLLMHFIAAVFFLFFLFWSDKYVFYLRRGVVYPYMFCLLYALPFCTRVCTHTSTHMHHGFLPVLCYGQEVFSLGLLKDKSQTLPRVFAFVDTTATWR